MDKGLLWLGPVCVLAFVLILTVMYGWVGDFKLRTPDGEIIGTPGVEDIRERTHGGEDFVTRTPGGVFGHEMPEMNLVNQVQPPLTGAGNGQNQPTWPYLGLSLGDVPDFVAKDMNIRADVGVYVKKVIPASPAEKSGLKGGDILLKCDHKKVNSPGKVGQILAVKKAGDTIKLVVNRNGRKKSYYVKLEMMPGNLMMAAATTSGPTWMGADIQDIDVVMKLRFRLPDNRGVILSYVAHKSPAQTAGLLAGDVIRRFGETRIRNVSQLKSLILKGRPGDQVQLTLLRNGQHKTLPIVLGQKPQGAGKTPFIAPADMAIEGTWIGMDVSELSAGGASALGLPAGTMGILVGDVESPPAITVGFQTGDVITAVNGMPTPDMKNFVTATKKQSSALVDVIRGNKHLYISVPPPGFTRQMTKINSGPTNMKQVAMSVPSRGRLAIFATGPDVNAYVAGNITTTPYLILVDLVKNSFAILNPNSLNALPGIVQQYNITALVCSNISQPAAVKLTEKGVVIYSGVVGTANDAIGLYESGSLIAMNQ